MNNAMKPVYKLIIFILLSTLLLQENCSAQYSIVHPSSSTAIPTISSLDHDLPAVRSIQQDEKQQRCYSSFTIFFGHQYYELHNEILYSQMHFGGNAVAHFRLFRLLSSLLYSSDL